MNELHVQGISVSVIVTSRTILNDIIQMHREIADCKEKEEAKKKELADLEEMHKNKLEELEAVKVIMLV